MTLLCVHIPGPAALAPSSSMFQRGDGPLLVALGFVKNDHVVLAISDLNLLESGERYGGTTVKENEENVVIVSWLAAACLRIQPFNRKDEEQHYSELELPCRNHY